MYSLSDPQARRFSRREVMGASAALAAGGLAIKALGSAKPAGAAATLKHLVWVWQFSTDGEPNVVGKRLRDNGLGIVLKTHDGLQWMSEYDKSSFAVSGPAQVGVLANYFETAGVPFHVWAVVQGVDPIREARMAADVLAAGARSIYLDVEPHSGFWRGTAADAQTFGNELRRLQPNAHIVLSLDPRPWIIERVPMAQFASFSSEIAPQQYWKTFDTSANYEKYGLSGYAVGPGGMTPEFLIGVTSAIYGKYGLPITHVGQGSTTDPAEWSRFIDNAYASGSNIVSVWRYGVTPDSILGILRDTPPKQPPAPAAASVYVVVAGDTLGGIAATFGVSVDDLVAANGIADPSYIYVGQEIIIPGGAAAPAAVAATPVSTAGGGAGGAGSGRSYTVVDGDTLYSIAGRYGTTVDAIVALNGLSDPNYIYVGQVLAV
ncbi:MAG TPA: LysM peptidoglycan-binding domain-containing protein [Dehalococcoidia bacterium]|nr:LysM peptidoglycan-binding domain-containing protein [Dehalococcoidia bacterium]